MSTITEHPSTRQTINWQVLDGTIEVRVALCAEPTGGFSVHALELPGVVSEGETEEEAIAQITDAIRTAIETYRQMGIEIPWQESEIHLEGCESILERRILVNA